jgi:hypothetical protein
MSNRLSQITYVFLDHSSQNDLCYHQGDGQDCSGRYYRHQQVYISYLTRVLNLYSLTKDMTGKEDAYRAGAIRALCRITDVGSTEFVLPWYVC